MEQKNNTEEIKETKNDIKKDKNMSFFKRFKKAIFELEDYSSFLGEHLTIAFVYFFKLVFVVTLIVSLATTFKISSATNSLLNYINNELPDFSYSDGKISFNDYFEGYDHEFGVGIIGDSSNNVSEETLKSYKKKIYDGNNGIIALQDKFILIYNSREIEGDYQSLFKRNVNGQEVDFSEEIQISSKADLQDLIYSVGPAAIVASYSVIVFINLLVNNTFIILSDICVVAIFGWFASRICGIGFKLNPMIAISIYALTLPITLSVIFDILFLYTGFQLKYFDVIYLLIAYVYMIAAIFMIKYDLMKHTEELKKLLAVQQQVRQEMDEEKAKEIDEEMKKEESKSEESSEEENKKDDKTEDDSNKKDENRDPDGSEI